MSDISQAAPTGPNAAEEKFALTTSPHFSESLARIGTSIAFSTYQAGKVFFLGVQQNGRLSVFERTFERCMGIGVAPGARSFTLATLYQLYRFDNVVPPGSKHDDNDAVFVPHRSWITGELDVHDIGILPDGNPVFVATLFGCIATVSEHHSFKPLWRPPFVDRLVPEDRCHLNGLAMLDGEPRYVTAVGRPNVSDGWRDQRAGGGMLIDIKTNDISAKACRCRIRPACMTAACGCSTPAPAISVSSIRTAASSRLSHSARAMREGLRSSTATR